MNKAELVEHVSQRTGQTLRETREMVDAIFDPDPSVGLIAAELVAGRKVAIRVPPGARAWKSLCTATRGMAMRCSASMHRHRSNSRV